MEECNSLNKCAWYKGYCKSNEEEDSVYCSQFNNDKKLCNEGTDNKCNWNKEGEKCYIKKGCGGENVKMHPNSCNSNSCIYVPKKELGSFCNGPFDCIYRVNERMCGEDYWNCKWSNYGYCVEKCEVITSLEECDATSQCEYHFGMCENPEYPTKKICIDNGYEFNINKTKCLPKNEECGGESIESIHCDLSKCKFEEKEEELGGICYGPGDCITYDKANCLTNTTCTWTVYGNCIEKTSASSSSKKDSSSSTKKDSSSSTKKDSSSSSKEDSSSSSKEENCEIAVPNNKNDCFKFSTNNAFCCYDQENQKCKEFTYEELKSNENIDKYECEKNTINEDSSSNNENENGLEACGIEAPYNIKDCKYDSEENNSCCLFKLKKDETKRKCYYLGKKFDEKKGEMKINEVEMKYECNANYLGKILNVFFFIFIFFYNI